MVNSNDSRSARIAIVERHIRLENERDLEGVLRTFGSSACYDDEAWGEHYEGRNDVRLFYEQILHALPDMEIQVRRQHVSDEAILVETVVRGTHLGEWRGLPATGRRVEFALCGVYTFDGDDLLAGERIYYDWASVLRQLGVFHEPHRLPGRIAILVTHPVTILRMLARKLLRPKLI
ncbi:MAG TPA: ester cyclase [Rhizomicrobium sp.]|nr:ester cyclase [Rhizomicrobium sp.]